jgi:ATP-dependent Lon protease
MQETAFLDRVKGILPGWSLPKLNNRSFAASSGLKADFFGDALIKLRDDLSADQYCVRRIKLKGTHTYRRNEESIASIASGMMKIMFPHGEVTDRDFWRYCVKPATALRQYVWNQLYQLDGEYRQYEATLSCSFAEPVG